MALRCTCNGRQSAANVVSLSTSLVVVLLSMTGIRAQGIRSRCDAPPVSYNEAAKVTCHFSENLSKTNRNFRVYRYSVDTRVFIEETVLDCYWLDRTRLECTTAPGYEFNNAVSDQLSVIIPTTTPAFVGRYECRAEPSYPRDVEECFLSYAVMPEHQVTKTSNQSSEHLAGEQPQDKSDDEGGVKVNVTIVSAVTVSTLVALLIGVSFLIWHFRHRIKPRCPNSLLCRRSQLSSVATVDEEGETSLFTGDTKDDKDDNSSSDGENQKNETENLIGRENEADTYHEENEKLVVTETRRLEDLSAEQNVNDENETSLEDLGISTAPNLESRQNDKGHLQPYAEVSEEIGDAEHSDQRPRPTDGHVIEVDSSMNKDGREPCAITEDIDDNSQKEYTSREQNAPDTAVHNESGQESTDTQAAAEDTPTAEKRNSENAGQEHRTTAQKTDDRNDRGRRYREGYPDKMDDPTKNENVLFYQNKIKYRPKGDFIDNIHRDWWDNFRHLERHHGYIQWLFPIRERGRNTEAQELQLHEAEEIQQDKEASARFIKSYEMMLNFYGLRLVDRDTGLVERAEHWREGFKHLHESSSHNYLRVTRILKCMGEMGLEHYKAPLIRHLLQEAVVEETLAFSGLLDSCERFWITTLRDDKEREDVTQLCRDLLDSKGPGWKPSQSESSCVVS